MTDRQSDPAHAECWDIIDTLTTQRDEAERKVADWRGWLENWIRATYRAWRVRDEALAEVQVLREALERIDYPHTHPTGKDGNCRFCIARDALATTPTPAEPKNDCSHDGGLCDHCCIDVCFREFANVAPRIPAAPAEPEGT